MCGFVVLVSTRPDRPLPHGPDEVDALRSEVAHRGPDDARSWTDPERRIAMAHRRLEVLDLVGGQQPLSWCGRFHLVYNGEIYNFRELRRELESHGHTFRSTGDTEVLAAAYAEWGPASVERLRGIFSFVVWDAEERRLFLARDPLGVKPIYLGIRNGVLYAASEAKAIVADPRVRRRIDPTALELYFHYGYVPAPHSIWEGLGKIPAGHRLTLDLDRPLHSLPPTEPYWTIPFGHVPPDPLSEEEALERLDTTLREAVRRQLVSDVPVGTFLSGGVDSSLVSLYFAETSDGPLRTFTVGFEDPGLDERPWARRLAERIGSEHHEIVLDPGSFDLFPSLARLYDEPFADPAALPTVVLSELARERVTVVLSGDGGDETHAGYPRYLRMKRMALADRVPLRVRRALLGPLARAFPSYWRRGGLEQLCRTELDRYDGMTRELPHAMRWTAYSDALRERLREVGAAPEGEESAPWRRSIAALARPGAPVVDRYQLLDLASYLPEQLMTKLDRATMRVGLEARVPLLDLEAVELAARLPTSLRARPGRPKHLLRRLLARKMGEEFVDRRKHGFRIPHRHWFRTLGPERLIELVFAEGVEHWLDRDRLGALLRHPRGTEAAWPFLAFSYWHQAYAPEGP